MYRSIQERLREAIAQNVSLGYELGVDNLRGLYVERDLLKRENELLKETEQGSTSRWPTNVENRYETKPGRSHETEK